MVWSSPTICRCFFGSNSWNNKLPKLVKRATAPLPVDYHSELDTLEVNLALTIKIALQQTVNLMYCELIQELSGCTRTGKN